jgi:hypothetical protein
MIRRAKSQGYGKTSSEELIGLRNQGIVKELRFQDSSQVYSSRGFARVETKIKTAYRLKYAVFFCFNGCGLLIASRPVGIIIYHIISPPGLT